MGWFDGLRRRGSGRTAARGAELPRATGTARQVEAVAHALVQGPRRRFLPTDDMGRVGSLESIEVLGPTRLRPGEADQPVEQPMRRVAELAHLARGTLEHRDSLGHRGWVSAPTVRGLSSGAGMLSELGWSRDIRRDGGDVELTTIRWVQDEASTPTVRRSSDIPARSQGRSTIRPLTGPDGPITWPIEQSAWAVEVAPGATLDLEVPDDVAIVVCVRSGEALVGDELHPVAADRLARLNPAGTRLTIATSLGSDEPTRLLVVAAAPRATPVVRDRLVLASDADDLEHARTLLGSGAFGRLPRLDG